jgi:hypothetical protein
VFRVLGSTLRMKAQVDSSSRGWKDFICREEKRKSSWGNGGGGGTQKLVVPWVRLEIGFYRLFVYYLRVEMSLRCRQTLPGKERCLLGQLSPFRTSCSLPFKSPLSVITLIVVRNRDNESLFSDCFLMTGGDGEALQHQG